MPRRTATLSPAAPAAAALLVGLTVVNVYRASTQSVVYDEAFTYLAFLSGPLSLVFTEYTANNHVLFSLLARLSTGLFGVSELTLRLPAVAAGIVYFAAIFALCRLVFGTGLLFLITTAALSLNPVILDFLSAARGYGVALASFIVALYLLTRAPVSDDGPPRAWWLGASLALATAVSASLTFAPPAVALAGAAVLTDAMRRPRARPFVAARHLRRAAVWLWGPGLVAGCAFLAVPLSRAGREHFFFGASTLGRTVTSLVEASFGHDAGAWPISAPEVAPDLLSRVVAWGIVAPTMVMVAWVVCLSVRRTVGARGRSPLDLVDRFLILVGGTLALTLILLVGARWWLNLPYPFARTGLYFIPLFVLAAAALIAKLRQSAGARTALAGAMLAMLALSVARCAPELTASYYYEWRYDAGTRDIFDIIATWPYEGDAAGGVRVAASKWLYSPSLNFYRAARRNHHVAPVEDGWESGEDYDFFVVSPADLDRAQLVAGPVYVHPVSGAVLLVNRRSTVLEGSPGQQ